MGQWSGSICASQGLAEVLWLSLNPTHPCHVYFKLGWLSWYLPSQIICADIAQLYLLYCEIWGRKALLGISTLCKYQADVLGSWELLDSDRDWEPLTHPLCSLRGQSQVWAQLSLSVCKDKLCSCCTGWLLPPAVTRASLGSRLIHLHIAVLCRHPQIAGGCLCTEEYPYLSRLSMSQPKVTDYSSSLKISSARGGTSVLLTAILYRVADPLSAPSLGSAWPRLTSLFVSHRGTVGTGDNVWTLPLFPSVKDPFCVQGFSCYSCVKFPQLWLDAKEGVWSDCCSCCWD